MSNDIEALRSTLFDTLRDLKAGTLDIDRAAAINETAQVIINSAKVELDAMKLSGSSTTPKFLAAPDNAHQGDEVRKVPGGRVITHRLK